MKQIVFLAAIAAVGYFAYQQWSELPGAFDGNGDPKTVVFTAKGCLKPCDDIARYFKNRRHDFEEVEVKRGTKTVERYHRMGGDGVFPLTVMGDERFVGFREINLQSALGKTYGMEAMTAREQEVFEKHFTAGGRPKLVLYETDQCGYCDKLRADLNDAGIEYTEFDIEQSRAAERRFDFLRGRGTPLVYIGFKRIQGYRPDETLASAPEYAT